MCLIAVSRNGTFLGTIPVDSHLPWDHIDVGLEDGFLLREYRKALSDRLSPRQWLLASAAYARRLWDFLPDGVLRQAIDFVERATEPLPAY